jgi:HlyD family secretion protein
MAEERKQTLRLWLWRSLAIIVILVFFISRYLLRDQLPVREVQVSRQALMKTVSTNGRVEPEVNYEIHSPLATSVQAVFVQPGDLVPAGKLLLELDGEQARARVASAESAVKAAQAAVEAATHNGTQQERQAAANDLTRAHADRDQARRDLDALIKLKATGAASASEVAAAQQRFDAAETSVHAAEQSSHSRYSPAEIARSQAELADAEANLAVARDVLAKTAPRAPIAGTVYSVNVAHSEFAEEGKLLVQMADLHHVRVRAYFDEPDIGQLAVGQKAEITWKAKEKYTWHGHIARVPITVGTYGEGTRTVGEVIVDLDDADGLLLPNTNVTVKVTITVEANTLSVPRQAVRAAENNKNYVFRVVGDRLVKTPVVVGTINLTQAAIVSGLNEGDWVATGTPSGQDLKEGVPIKVAQ